MYSVTIRSSASEIGRSPFFGSVTSLIFGIGVMFAVLQEGGTLCSLKEVSRMSVMGSTSNSAYSFKSQFGIESGASDLYLLRRGSKLYTQNVETSKVSTLSSQFSFSVDGSSASNACSGPSKNELIALAISWSD